MITADAKDHTADHAEDMAGGQRICTQNNNLSSYSAAKTPENSYSIFDVTHTDTGIVYNAKGAVQDGKVHAKILQLP